MFHRGRHRARRGCSDHLHKIEELQKDLRWYQTYHDRFVAEIDGLKDQLCRLQNELGSEEPTQTIPSAQVYRQLKQHAPDAVAVTRPGGITMLLPVGNNQARRVQRTPKWAARD